MMNASICPVTIINSLMVTIRPRRCAGAISARNSGQVAAAAPTPSPRTIRATSITSKFGRDGAAQGADQEQAGADQQAALAAQRVGQLPAEQRAERGTGEQQRADHQRFLGRGQSEVVLHVQQGAGDHPGVVAEQQATEGRDHRQLDQEPVVLAGRSDARRRTR